MWVARHLQAMFAISIFIARYGRYILVRQATGTRIACYRAVPPKINHRWSIEGEIDRRQSIEGEKGKKKKRKIRKKRRGEEGTYFPRDALARRPCPWVARIDIWEERKVFGSHGQVLKDDVFGRNIDNRNRTEKGIAYKLVRISNI
ncbi:hypothetical protein GW17_00038526 [Ensete ventricosum]|nr:hypothetical protein GW17_00038526 [Ensete ventricosum]